jgi:hypothetical protein
MIIIMEFPPLRTPNFSVDTTKNTLNSGGYLAEVP